VHRTRGGFFVEDPESGKRLLRRGDRLYAQLLPAHPPGAAGSCARGVPALWAQRRRHVIPPRVVAPAIALLESFGLDVWLYRGADWFVRDLGGPHVDREAWTVKFPPTLVTDFDDLTEDIAKIVGVSDDHDKVAAASSAAHEQFADHVSAARSQPYYLDITHPHANKGTVVQYLAHTFRIPAEQVATIGDMPNDVLMFAHSGLSIVMGNASMQVQRAARRVTTSNDDEGFANAVQRYVLPGG
jgi:Cof subfamily protein (haloacid dehalogenase superfamily)